MSNTVEALPLVVTTELEIEENTNNSKLLARWWCVSSVPNLWIVHWECLLLVLLSLPLPVFLSSLVSPNNNNPVLTVNDPKTQVGHLFLEFDLYFFFAFVQRRAGDRLSFISAVVMDSR